MGYYIIIQSEYADPAPMVGPFPTFDAAVERYWERIIESGYDPEDGENAHDSYLTDDAVKIGHVESER